MLSPSIRPCPSTPVSANSGKEELGVDHVVPLTRQAIAILRALWPLTGDGPLVFPSTRHMHQPMSENALGYLLNRAGYHGHHVPHGFRAAFSTVMNEWAERHGKESDRAIIDLMLAHVPKGKVEGAYNCTVYMPRRRALALVWADMLCAGLPEPIVLVERPTHPTGTPPRRFNPAAVDAASRFPVRRRAAVNLCFSRAVKLRSIKAKARNSPPEIHSPAPVDR
jgi:hypothetical protein